MLAELGIEPGALSERFDESTTCDQTAGGEDLRV